MSVICAFDQTEHADVDSLHEHLKSIRVARKRYYEQYAPRHDRATGAPIPFKDYEQYMSQDFVSKITLKKWLKENPREGWEWSKEFLAKRRAAKGLIYAPSQAELRTLCCPSMPYYQSIGAAEGGYYGVTESLGYKRRYTSTDPIFASLSPDSIIIQDTREQSPILFPDYTTAVGTLSVGDYAVSPTDGGDVRIERKSLSDFCGTMSGRRVTRKSGDDSAYQRFARALERAQEGGIYMVMVVEASITDAQRFDYLPQTKWIKASPAYIFRNMRELLHQFPLTWQILFVDGRKEMARVIPKIFQLGDRTRNFDCQFLYEEGKL